MDISYIHTPKRKNFGQPCSFTDVGPHLLAEVEPDPDLKAKFYVMPSIEKEVHQTEKICVQEVNTISSSTQSRDMNHKEGGWSAGIDIEDEDIKARFRKNTEKDKNYTNAVENLGNLVENLAMGNNSIDIYEEYFADERIKLKHETTFQTVSAICDPNDTARKVMNLSWSADSSKVAGAYSVDGIGGSISDIGVDSYVWDIGNNSNPYCVLLPESCLNCVEFSPTVNNILLGGYASGQLALWDIRIGGHAQLLSDVKEGHKQKVTGIKWLATKSSMDFFSVSTDGRVMSWDARNLSQPTEKIYLAPEDGGIPNLDRKYTVSCAEYAKTRPDNFMLGTEQGHVLSFCRKYDLDGSINFSTYDSKCGPVLKLGRNPFFPQLFASCDPYEAKLWVEKDMKSPILNLISQEGFCTDYVWSPTRASVLYITKTTGVVEVWDILGQHFRPTTSIRFGKGSLKSVSVNASGQQLACGTDSGNIHLMAIPDQFKNSSDFESILMATSVGCKEEPIEKVELKASATPDDLSNPAQKSEDLAHNAFEKLFISLPSDEK